MKHLIASAALIWSAVSAAAAEKTTVQISPEEAAQLVIAIGQLDGSTHVVKDDKGADKAVVIPYHFGAIRVVLAHDLRVAVDAVKDYQTAAKGIAPDEARKLADAKLPVDLVTIDATDLFLSENPISAQTLAALAPICPSCVAK